MEQTLRIKVTVDKQTGELSTINAEVNKIDDSALTISNYQNKLNEFTNNLSSIFSALKDAKILTVEVAYQKEVNNLKNSTQKLSESTEAAKEKVKATESMMVAAFDSINKAMEENFFKALTGKFKNWGAWLKDFSQSIETSTAKSLSKTLSDNLTGSLKSLSKTLANDFTGNIKSGYGWLSSSLSVVGEQVNASDIASLMNSGGLFNADTNTITTAGGTAIKLAGDGSGTVSSQGNDALSFLNIASSLKTAYGLMTNGVSGTILNGFQSVAGGLASMELGSMAGFVEQFGVGFASPFATQAASATAANAGGLAGLYGSGVGDIGGAQLAGSYVGGAVVGAGIGYGVGALGDKIFGAQTKAKSYGAIGGTIGSVVGSIFPFIGTFIGGLIGSALGSVIGGMFGSKKVTGSANGIDIFGNATANSAAGQYWAETYYQKKSWFRSKSWTEYWAQGFSDKEITAIKSTIGVYDYLLEKLGNYSEIVVSGGRFSSLQNFLDTNVTKAFLAKINPNNLDEIYQSWVDYAKSIDKTIAEALATSVGNYVTYQRGYTEWKLGSGTTEQLKFTADYLQKDFEALAGSMGASTVTVDNFLSMYDAAIKNNFTESTIEIWANLGDALMKSTDATKKYQDALNSLNKSTAYTLPRDMLLQKLSTPTISLDLNALVSAQSSGNTNLDKMVSYLYELIKTQQELLKVTKYGSNQGIPA